MVNGIGIWGHWKIWRLHWKGRGVASHSTSGFEFDGGTDCRVNKRWSMYISLILSHRWSVSGRYLSQTRCIVCQFSVDESWVIPSFHHTDDAVVCHPLLQPNGANEAGEQAEYAGGQIQRCCLSKLNSVMSLYFSNVNSIKNTALNSVPGVKKGHET